MALRLDARRARAKGEAPQADIGEDAA